MRSTVWPLLALLVIAHHDFWFWDDPSLSYGWLPIGLLYHISLSMIAAGFWQFAVKSAWPVGLDEVSSSSGSTAETAEAPQV